MRCFIAIDIGEEVRDAISRLIIDLKKFNGDIRWVPIKNVHITLRFLGDIKKEMIEDIKKAIKNTIKEEKKFILNIRGTGVFPEQKKPRVLWVGIDNSQKLLSIYQKIQKEIEILGFQKEKRNFNPHITIGRVKSNKGIRRVIKELIRFNNKEFGKIHVDKIMLMQSILKPTGAEYKEIFSGLLNKEA